MNKGVVFLCLFLLPAPVLAWGPQGHEIVADIAFREMTPAARDHVSALLGGDARIMMAANANWADELRQERPRTARWHYVNIELGSSRYDAARDCPDDDCIVAQIEKDRRILADGHAPRSERVTALRFLIHFLGDIHQPLHAADNHDRGGNDIQVTIGRYRTNMHHLWDGDLVTALGVDPARVAWRIETRFSHAQKKAWQAGTSADWALESFRVAVSDIYAPLRGSTDVMLPRSYEEAEAPIVRAQLEKGGLRLAWILNGIFK
jgi:hypothetical protein